MAWRQGATLGLQGGITVTDEAITISGSGLGGNGAIRNLSGANRLTGPVTLSADSEIQARMRKALSSAARSPKPTAP